MKLLSQFYFYISLSSNRSIEIDYHYNHLVSNSMACVARIIFAKRKEESYYYYYCQFISLLIFQRKETYEKLKSARNK
ncbi:unnamed protein product [Rotaria socialis]